MAKSEKSEPDKHAAPQHAIDAALAELAERERATVVVDPPVAKVGGVRCGKWDCKTMRTGPGPFPVMCDEHAPVIPPGK